MGRLINKNKKTVAENAVKEVLKEILRLKAANSTISQTDLDIVMRNINNRITFNGLSSKEIMFNPISHGIFDHDNIMGGGLKDPQPKTGHSLVGSL